MNASTLNVCFALTALLIIVLAGWLPFKQRLTTEKHSDFPMGETLATGVFLGAALLHMLPESNALFVERQLHYPFAYVICGIVFLFFLWFEHLGKELYHHHDHSHPAFAMVAWLMLSIHSFVSGTALGLSHDYATQIMIFLAIVTHKWAESFAIAIQLNKSTLSMQKTIPLFIVFALMTPFGIWVGWFLGQDASTHSLMDPILMSVSAGTFLYLGTLHGLERCVMVERCCNLNDFSFVIVGFLLMAAVAAFI